MREEQLYQKIIQNTFKTVHKIPKTLPGHIKKSAQGTKVPKNNTDHIQNSAQATDVAYNQTEQMQNSVQRANVKKKTNATYSKQCPKN